MKKIMSKSQVQNIFRRSAVERLRNDLRSGNSLQSYMNETKPTISESDLWSSTISVEGKPPVLLVPAEDPASGDLANAIQLHDYYKNIDETQASDPRLWTYLSHIEFRSYSLKRWGLAKPIAEMDLFEKTKAINFLLEHWFISGNDRDLRRHAIARLWWAAHLTYAPWESDPEFFGELKNEDPYFYTRILLSTQDIYQQLLERAMGRSNRILISVLEYLNENKEFAGSRENVRALMKELNLQYGTKKIISLDKEALHRLIRSIGSDIEMGQDSDER